MLGIVLFNSDRDIGRCVELIELRISDFTHAQIDQILVNVEGRAVPPAL